MIDVLQEVRTIGSGRSDFLIGDGSVMSTQTSRQNRTAASNTAARRSEHCTMVLDRASPSLNDSMRDHCCGGINFR